MCINICAISTANQRQAMLFMGTTQLFPHRSMKGYLNKPSMLGQCIFHVTRDPLCICKIS